jgi:ABC-type transporter MlaC component
MRSMRVIVGLIAVAATIGPASAAADPPVRFVEEAARGAIAVLGDPKRTTREKYDAVRQIAERTFDWPAMARAALGLHWAGRSPSEQQSFTTLLLDSFGSEWFNVLRRYKGEALKFERENQPGGQILVICMLQGHETKTEYLVKPTGASWRVVKINVRDVNVMDNRRAQYDRVIKLGSFADLERTLRQKQVEFLGRLDAASHVGHNAQP